MDLGKIKTAFFSMEIGLNDEILTYSGGLGILAGDALKSCADLKLPVAGITLLYKKGYFRQRVDEEGHQTEEEQEWDYEKILKRLGSKVTVRIGNEEVAIACWLYELEGASGARKPVLFLDTDLEENSEYFRKVCHKLYQGGKRERLAQEMILGIGGVRMMESLGYNVKKYHMNEGHTSFLALELYRTSSAPDRLEDVRSKCVFTTHTPVPAGHDIFSESDVRELAAEYIPDTSEIDIFDDGKLNMTHLGFRFSGYINGVARKHRKVSTQMFPEYAIESVTNGIHTSSWTADSFKALFKNYMQECYDDPFSLRSAMNIPEEEIWEAHMQTKKMLFETVKQKTGTELELGKFTLGYARRFVEYKRPDMIFYDIKRLERIAEEKGGLQVIFAGKAHPADVAGKGLIKKIIETRKKISSEKIKIVFLEDYCISTAKLMISGCDAWLNNPQRPYEASGTSGMKAAVNGVPQLSTLDGWWLEGHIEDVTGWSIGLHPHEAHFDEDTSPDDEAEDFYNKMEKKILPMFYSEPDKWRRIMKSCIAINGSFFNTHRMMQQYVMEAYFK